MAESIFRWSMIHGNFLLSGIYWLISSCLNTSSIAVCHYTDNTALFYEYLHQSTKPPLLNTTISILNCHSCQFPHCFHKSHITDCCFVSLSVYQPCYKWNCIITVSHTWKVNQFKCRLSSATFSAPLWKWTKVSSSLWCPSFKVHTRVFLMNFNFFIIENEAGSSSIFKSKNLCKWS